ncbi:N-acetylmuramoyl-L-alanine amidase family protein [Paenibacillus xylanexedens]|uniref:peptidoglycan recognition protein family protein n=1 Tax=Paenibacillus xylanexedens TaxID=528191 RepID=UPI0011A2E178|nr:N-acetylmuramoyl-L-alanine amidase [Paenibacillus xylanexedens]
MLPIQKMLITVNDFSRPGIKLKSKRGIVMHYTADPGASALNINNYFDSLKKQSRNDNVKDTFAGAHIQVDRKNKVQGIPFDEMGYHCGSSQPYMAEALAKLGSYPNNSTIGIEMCIEKDGSIHEDTFQNAVEVVVHLIQNEGFPEVIFTHKGVVGWKDCPLPWVRKPSEFERFKAAVRARLSGAAVVEKPVAAQPIAEEEEKLELSTYQWDMLVNTLTSLNKKNLITDPAWIEKAKTKKLTVSDLLFVNTVIIDRTSVAKK